MIDKKSVSEIPCVISVYRTANECRKLLRKPRSTKNSRRRSRKLYQVELLGCLPQVVMMLDAKMTFERISETLSEQGIAISRSSIGRFSMNIIESRIEDGVIAVALENGRAYVFDASTYELISALN